MYKMCIENAGAKVDIVDEMDIVNKVFPKKHLDAEMKLKYHFAKYFEKNNR